jgi:hypothetical protein
MKWGHVVWQAFSCPALTLLLVLVGSRPGAAATTDGGPLAWAGGIQGDADCSGSVNPVDGLVILRQDSGSAEAPCAELADVQCDGDIDPIDALQLLRFDAGLSVTQNPGCSEIGEPIGGGASSVDLIEEALEEGDLTEEEALLFTAFAVFGDSRLPDEFEGAASTEDTLVLQRLSAAFDTLSTETQEAVAPFMLPPSAPESWLELSSVQGTGPSASSAVTWQTFSAAEGNAKVWAQDRYDGDADKAEALAAAVTDTIYPLLTGLMQREPEGDEAFPNNGGDAAIDIYLVHMEAPGEMKSYGNACGAAPGYILLDSRFPLGSATTPGILQNAAHEFFHILEWTYQLARCWYPEYRWAIEGFAKFAEDFAYPNAQSEHFSAPSLLLEPHISLDHAQGGHAYGTYLLPYYLWREAGDASIVRQIWEAFEGNQNSIQAVGSVLGGLGGWDEVWPEVALRNWNRQPVDDYQSDGLELGAAPEGGAIIEMSEARKFSPAFSTTYRPVITISVSPMRSARCCFGATA